MDAFTETYRKKKNAEGIELGMTRIGVHSGNAIVGNFGGDLFFDYTAARLEGANKFLGTRICVSENVTEQIPEFTGRPVGRLILKGKTDGLTVYEPQSVDQAQSPATNSYREAFAKLEAGDPGASQAFAALVGQYGEDPLATFHLKRLLAGDKGVEIAFSEK